jgi:hypothetical protein
MRHIVVALVLSLALNIAYAARPDKPVAACCHQRCPGSGK